MLGRAAGRRGLQRRAVRPGSGCGSENREVPLYSAPTATTAGARWRGAGARSVLMGVYAGTWQVSLLSCLRTLPFQAVNSRGVRMGPSAFVSASNSSRGSKRVKNLGPRSPADGQTQDSSRWQATKEGIRAPGQVPPAGLTSAAATQARARCASGVLLATLVCAQVHTPVGGPHLTPLRMSSLPVAGEAPRNECQIPELSLLPTPTP